MFPPSPRDEEAVSEPLAYAESLSVARLEYGKFCVAADGPIEDMAEHRQLGWSKKFPLTLLSFCDPSIIGISSGSGSELSTDKWDYGTILRPVVISPHEVWPVFCRVRTRAEDGEGGDGRLYTLARYVVAEDEQASPAALLAAMKSESLSGLRHADAANLRHLTARELPPRATANTIAFLNGAIPYVLSGIPLSVRGEVEEEEFFNWVSALWYLLPPVLRPYLSAGWRVESSLAGQLVVTHAAQLAANCAIFSISRDRETGETNRKWKHPSTYFTWKNKELIREKFSDERLLEGRMYAQHIYRMPLDEAAVITSFARSEEKYRPEMEKLTEQWPAFRFKKLPNMLNRTLMHAFRYPGLRAYDDYRFQLLTGWLDEAKISDRSYFITNAQRFKYPDYQKRALEAAIDALDETDTRPRGDKAIWRSFAGEPPRDFFDIAAHAGNEWAERARLIVSIRTRNAADVLNVLSRVGSKAEGFHSDIVNALHGHLQTSIQLRDDTLLALHEQLLLGKSAPQVYLAWVSDHAFDVLLALISVRGTNQSEVAERVRNLAAPTDIELLSHWTGKLLPGPQDEEWLGLLAPASLSCFAELVIKEWRRASVAEDREIILKWLLIGVFDWRRIVICSETVKTDPLLSLAFSRALSSKEFERLEGEIGEQTWSPSPLHEIREFWRRDLHEEEMKSLVGDVARRAVPPYLEHDLALFLLKRWSDVGTYARQIEAHRWKQIAAWWPEDFALTLLNIVNASPFKNISEEMKCAIESFTISPGELSPLMSDWHLFMRPQAQKVRIAKTLWHWAARSRPSALLQSTAVDLCRDLANMRLDTDAPPGGDLDFIVAVELAKATSEPRELKDPDRQLWKKESGQQLWKKAIKPWHLRLLLTLFPRENFVPTRLQLSELVYYRQWLRTHLDSGARGSQRENFNVAAKNFHEVDYPGSDGVRWSNTYLNSVLWAVFRGAPPSSNIDLAAALRAYDRTGNKHMSMCWDYLMAYDSTEKNYAYAVKRVLQDVVLPSLWGAGRDRRDVETLFARIYNEEREDGGSLFTWGKKKKVRMADTAMHNLLVNIIVNSSWDFVLGEVRIYFESKKR
jgi:hypothetical protein